MAAPEGGSVLLIPRRYLAAGALALFVCAGVPPADVALPLPPLQSQMVVVPRYTPPPSTTFVRQGYVEAPASVDAPTPGRFVVSQVIPPYRSPNWVTPLQLQDVVVGVVPEADQHIDVPNYRQRADTNFVNRGVPPTAVVAAGDELMASRREIRQARSLRNYYGYRDTTWVSGKFILADFTDPIEYGLIVVTGRKYNPGQSWTGSYPPPDTVPVDPIHGHIRIVQAIYPYSGETRTFAFKSENEPAEGGVLVIPFGDLPNYANRSFVRNQSPPPATVVVAQDEEAWASRRSIVVPTRPYNAGQFLLAKVPVANVVVSQDETAWTSRRSINLKDYSDLWRNPNLTRALFKQIEEDLSLRPGNYAIVIPPEYPYNSGQFRRARFVNPTIIAPDDELLRSRRLISLAPWRQKYIAGNTVLWTPRPDNLIVPVTFACISIEEDPVTLATITEYPVTIITVEVEC